MEKNIPIQKSTRFTVYEILGYLALCIIQAAVSPAQGKTFFTSFIINLLAGYLSLVIAIATTWYVVFTFYLMKSTIEFNQQMSTPFVNISWEICSGDPDYVANILEAEETTTTTGTIVTGPNSRWVALIIMNARAKPIDKVEFHIGVEGESASLTRKPCVVHFDRQHLHIEKDHTIKVGIVDILQIPRDMMLVLDILDLRYQSIDSTDIMTDYTGEGYYTVAGMGMMMPGETGPAGGLR